MAPFESLPAAQEAIDGWVHAYNHARPHRSLGMVTPASLFRPHGPSRDDAPPQSARGLGLAAAPQPLAQVIEPPPAETGSGAVEFEVRVPPQR